MRAPPIIVSLAQINNSPLLVNVFPLVRLELSVHPVLVLDVTPIARVAPDSLSTNVHHAPLRVLLTQKDVVYQTVVNPSTSTCPLRSAKIVTRVVQAVLVLALVIAWHAQALIKFCVLDHVFQLIARVLFLTMAFVCLTWCKYQIPHPHPQPQPHPQFQEQLRLRLRFRNHLVVRRLLSSWITVVFSGGRFCLWCLVGSFSLF